MSVVVVMGVSGSGKTTLAAALATALHVPFAEGDDLHPAANRAKMAAGIPLTDDDRLPWLGTLRDWAAAHPDGSVLSCSALRRVYRDVLRGAGDVLFVHVVAPRAVLLDRMTAREGHFMPASLLDSQLATLEPLEADEPGLVLDAREGLDQLVQQSQAFVQRTSRACQAPAETSVSDAT